jgi:hypothetical protein
MSKIFDEPELPSKWRIINSRQRSAKSSNESKQNPRIRAALITFPRSDQNVDRIANAERAPAGLSFPEKELQALVGGGWRSVLEARFVARPEDKAGRGPRAW